MVESPWHIPKYPTPEEFTFLDNLEVDTVKGIIFKDGKEIGSVRSQGYVTITFFKPDGSQRVFRRNHVVWYKHHGSWPTFELDHDNRIKVDDRIENLKQSTRMANMANLPQVVAKGNGLPPGVSIHKATGRYAAYTQRKHIKKHLGYFATAEEAIAARNAELEKNPYGK